MKPIPILASPAGSHRDAVCGACSMGVLCLAPGVAPDAACRPDALGTARIALRRGETLFSAGDPFTALYAVRSGSLKSRLTFGRGREAVAGFHLAGDLLGLEGIDGGRHIDDEVALEETRLCRIPYPRLQQTLRSFTGLQHAFLQLMSRQIGVGRATAMLGGLRADERVATFLLDLAQRMKSRGFSSSSLVLRMSRADIGNHLGLQLETVSRCLTKLHQQQVLSVRHKEVDILDRAALQRLAQRIYRPER